VISGLRSGVASASRTGVAVIEMVSEPSSCSEGSSCVINMSIVLCNLAMLFEGWNTLQAMMIQDRKRMKTKRRLLEAFITHLTNCDYYAEIVNHSIQHWSRKSNHVINESSIKPLECGVLSIFVQPTVQFSQYRFMDCL